MIDPNQTRLIAHRRLLAAASAVCGAQAIGVGRAEFNTLRLRLRDADGLTGQWRPA